MLFILISCIPARTIIPVDGATSSDWNHDTFWFKPWGTSGVHKGIDIFGKKGIAALSPTSGVVIFAGNLPKGGSVVAVLGAKWQVHYLAHLQQSHVHVGDFVSSGSKVGTLGDTGNAQGKPPHLHYSIVSLVPLPWRGNFESQGWKKMFYLNPHEVLSNKS